MRPTLLLPALALTLGIALGAPVAGQPARSVRGLVRIEPVPGASPPPLAVTPEHRGSCGASVPSEELVVGEGGALAGVVVWIEGAPLPDPRRGSGSVPAVRLDNRGCRFVPHVDSATVGARLEAGSSDAFFHNVHARLGERSLFNLPIVRPGMVVRHELREPGHVVIGCDVHAWMKAHVHVFPHPWHAVTGPDGRFDIGLPPGRARLRLKTWHERLGTRELPLPRGREVQVVYSTGG